MGGSAASCSVFFSLSQFQGEATSLFVKHELHMYMSHLSSYLENSLLVKFKNEKWKLTMGHPFLFGLSNLY